MLGFLAAIQSVQATVHTASGSTDQRQSNASVDASSHVHESDSTMWTGWLADASTMLDPSGWSLAEKLLFCAVIIIAMEILQFITAHLGAWLRLDTIPVRGKHLDEFSSTDHVFVTISKIQTGPFVYFLLSYWMSEQNILWSLQDATLANVILPVPLMFIVFDFFYTIMHWALHIKAVYGFIHKHHHHQKAPSRAVVDAVNVHPVEFILGEYNHLWTMYLIATCLEMPIHILGALIFVASGGILAGLNHTRYDVEIKFFGINLYDSKAHDVHHRIPQSNYGQYTVFWDWVFGTFRPYNGKDRVNPASQLDPATGKTKKNE